MSASRGRLLDRLTAGRRLVFVNLVNELMVAQPPEDYARRMAVVTPRELWTCFPGDVLVIPAPMPEAFRDYCLGLLGLERDSVTIVATPELFTAPLAEAFTGAAALERLRSALRGQAFALDPFGLDLPTLDLARRLDLPILGYAGLPSASVMALYYWLNTKAGFKQLAHELGLPALAGRYCPSPAGVATVAADGAAWKIKINRGSNGYGHLDLAGPDGGVGARLEPTSSGYLLEPLVADAVDSPSVELHVSPAGPLVTYTCSMRVPGGAFTGMLTPPAPEHAATRARLEAHALTFGEYLHRAGVHGFCDVDAVVGADDRFWFSETNLRKTGGTYLDILVRRLIGEDYEASHTWLADSRALRDEITFTDALARLRAAGLAYDPGPRQGVILTADTLHRDRRLRYVCLARSAQDALAQETAVGRHFAFAGA